MDFKTFWTTTHTAFILKNILAALAVLVIVLTLVLVRLKHYTEHGVEVEIPEVAGMYLTEAQAIAQSEGLKIVVVDSTYSNKVAFGTIVEQTPPANSHAKHGRAIYVIINSNSARMIPLPELRDMTQRLAEATLKSIGLNVTEVNYEPSEFKDLVLDIRLGEESLQPGDRLPEGSNVQLVVGRGPGTEMVTVPNLQGRSLLESRSLLLAQSLSLGIYEFDEDPEGEVDETQYVVWHQTPEAGETVLEGSRVDLNLTLNIEKAIVTNNESDEGEFF